MCAKDLCVYCRFDFNNIVYCVDCYQIQQGISDDLDPISAEVMMTELAEHGMQLNITDPIESVLGLYNTTINDSMNVVYDRNVLESRVHFPIENSNFLENLPVIMSFDFDNGGIFINDPRLSDSNIVDIMQLFSELLIISNARDERYTNSTYMLLPDMLIKFAQQSRVHFGYRLLQRTLRHCLEFENFETQNGTASVTKYQDKLGLIVQQKVKASMRANVYNTRVLFTKNEIVACSCTCKSGGQNNQKIVCVHILPIIYKITLLLHRGLAEHMLLEFCALFKSRDVLTFNDLHLDSLQESLLTLKKVTTKYTLEDDTKNVGDMLQSFELGTDRSKQFKRTRKSSDMIAFGKMDHRSLRKKISEKIHVRSENDHVEPVEPVEPFDPIEPVEPVDPVDPIEPIVIEKDNSIIVEDMKKETYVKIIKLISAIFTKMRRHDHEFDDSFLYTNIGYRVLSSRAELNFATIKYPSTELKNNIDELFKQANVTMRHYDRLNIPLRNESELESKNDDDSEYDNVVDLDFDVDSEAESVINDIGSNDESSDGSETMIPAQLFESNKTTKIPSEKKSYYSCCVCGKTQTKNPQLVFYKFPITLQKPLSEDANDKHRFTFAKRLYRQQLYYQRWQVSKLNKSSKRLMFCNQHDEEKEYLPITYRKLNGQMETKSDWVKVPKDPTKESSRTRTDTVNRLSYERNRKVPSTKQSTAKKRNQPFHNKCDFLGCKNKASDKDVKVMRVPPERKQLSIKQQQKNLPRLRHATVTLFRKLVLKSMGITKNTSNSYRICNHHPVHEVEQEVTWYDTKERKMKTKVQMNLPKAIGCNSSLNDVTVSERQNDVINVTQQTLNNSRLLFDFKMRKLLNESLELLRKSMQQEQTFSKRISVENVMKKATTKKTYLTWEDCTDKYMKMTTGFPTKAAFISFICIICDGEIEIIRKRVSAMSWFEEWVAYFQIQWGKHILRWQDAEFNIKMSERTLRRVFDSKQKQHKKTRYKWPVFVTFEEDEALRKAKWNDEYKGRRLVMWDLTDIKTYQPSDANNQRQTYSQYYGGNVAKGGVFVQPCGWSGTHELYPGSIGDSEYMVKSGAIILHEQYLQKHDSENQHIKFHMMLDKGFRITAQCYEEGGQMVVQPNFAKSDEKFTAFQTLRSAAVAADRSANERAVKYMKICGYLKYGLNPGEDENRLADVWTCWGFQTNFLYKPVL